MVLDGHKGEKLSGIEWLHDGDSNAFFFTSGIQFIALGITSDGKISPIRKAGEILRPPRQSEQRIRRRHPDS